MATWQRIITMIWTTILLATAAEMRWRTVLRTAPEIVLRTAPRIPLRTTPRTLLRIVPEIAPRIILRIVQRTAIRIINVLRDGQLSKIQLAVG